MQNLRGEPTIEEILEKIERVWKIVPELSFARLIACATVGLGLIGERLGNAIFSGALKDSDFLYGLHYWVWQSRDEIPSPCPYCGVAWGEHGAVKR